MLKYKYTITEMQKLQTQLELPNVQTALCSVGKYELSDRIAPRKTNGPRKPCYNCLSARGKWGCIRLTGKWPW